MPLKILLVDDDEGFRNTTALALESEGCTVTQADDGLTALHQLESERPDLIISDLHMPRVDGIELSRLIRQKPALAKTPFLMLTGLRTDLFENSSQHRADLWLSKGIEFRSLYSQILRLACR